MANQRALGKKEYLIETLFKLTRYEDDCQAWFGEMIINLKRAYPDLDQAYFNRLVTNGNYQEIIVKTKKLYDTFFTIEELQEMIDFWSSDIGRKMQDSKFRNLQINIGEDFASDLNRNCHVEIDRIKNQK